MADTNAAGIPTVLAPKLSDYTPYQYDVLFTNPVCGPYPYDEPVPAQDGTMLMSHPRDAYCTIADRDASGARASSPC